MTETFVVAYFDGECLNNNDPDPSHRTMRACYVIGNKQYIAEAHAPIPSNNVAEYMGLVQLLDYIHGREITFPGTGTRATHFVIMGDSQLVINQMLGTFKVRNPALLPFHGSARTFVANMVHVHKLKIEFRWVPREGNLAGKLLDATKVSK